MQGKNNVKKKVFIYARKSKFTKQSESIETQIDRCRQYIDLNLANLDISDDDIEEYCDEGWSGKNLNRPKFKEMNQKIKNGECGYVIVYRLDRISRSVADFSNLLSEFQKAGVSFISVTERFDTTSSTGHLMMVITSAFAEFERRIIAERVRDNMHKLAESGRWLGGITPLGFSSEKVKNSSHIDLGDNTERTEYRLIPNENEIKTVKLIYRKFLELQSLSKLKTFLLNGDIKTRNGCKFTPHTIKEILKNPVYCTADCAAYEYFTENGCDLCIEDNDLEQSKGFIAFNKTQSDDKRTKNPMSEWIIAIGKHEGIISGEDWVRAQHIIELNANKGYRKSKNPIALLSGVLRCSCGSYMRPKYNRDTKDGERSFVYMCELKESSKKKQCGSNNLNGGTADRIVCDLLLNYEVPSNPLNSQLETLRRKLKTVDETNLREIKRLQKQINEQKAAKENLFNFIGRTPDEALQAEAEQKLKECNSTIKSLESEIDKLENADKLKEKYTAEFLSAESILKTFKSNFDTLSVTERRELIKGLFENITWDGENLSVFICGSR